MNYDPLRIVLEEEYGHCFQIANASILFNHTLKFYNLSKH